MTYKETLDFLFSSIPMFHQIGAAAYKANLDNTVALDDYLGHPHEKFKSIHVAGTNGKGSVCHMLAAILQTAGYKTGLYTSPHLKDFRERIRINGECISETKVISFIQKHKSFIESLKPSFFEMSMAMAFDHFREEKIDIAVVETGMGGRLDSTNIIEPVVSVITNIGMDHTRFLGNSLKEIAGEKAGIIKAGIPVVIGESQEILDVFLQKAQSVNAPVYVADADYIAEYSTLNLPDKQSFRVYRNGDICYEHIETDLLGIYQRKNLPTVLKTIDLLKDKEFCIPDNCLLLGLSTVRNLTGLRGRWEIIGFHPLIVCDTAHNREGIMEIVNQIANTPHRNLHVIFGLVEDKDAEPILATLPREGSYYFTQAGIPRAMKSEILAETARRAGLKGSIYPNPPQALAAAKRVASSEDLIIICGSTFVVAEVI